MKSGDPPLSPEFLQNIRQKSTSVRFACEFLGFIRADYRFRQKPSLGLFWFSQRSACKLNDFACKVCFQVIVLFTVLSVFLHILLVK